jgi:hypothetical protein
MNRLVRVGRVLLPALAMAVSYASVAYAHGGGDDGEPSTLPPIALSSLLGVACYLFMVWDIPGGLLGRSDRPNTRTNGRDPE